MDTLFVGKNLIFLSEVQSTNTYAIELLRNVNCIDGTVIHTNNQTKGRGQRGAMWQASKGENITASVILKPTFLAVKDSFLISKISALAIYDLLTDLLPNSHNDIKIKWPNDIFVNKKKIAGILIENQLNGNQISATIIGVGININQTNFNAIDAFTTSLNLILNTTFLVTDVLNLFCTKLEKWYLKLKTNKILDINDAYLQKLFGLNMALTFCDENENKFIGTIVNVDSLGKLEVIVNNKKTAFDLKQIRFLNS